MKKGILIGIVVVAVILIIIGIVSFSGNKSGTSSDESSSTSAQTPKEVYTAYHTEFDNMKSLDDYIALANKYAASELKSQISQLGTASAETKSLTFNLLKAAAPKTSEFTNVQESISGDIATLTITTSRDLTGNIQLKKEGNSWKISKDNWS